MKYISGENFKELSVITAKNTRRLTREMVLFNLLLVISYFFQTDQFHASTTLCLISNQIINCSILACEKHLEDKFFYI